MLWNKGSFLDVLDPAKYLIFLIQDLYLYAFIEWIRARQHPITKLLVGDRK